MLDERAQISAEMILLMGALLILVIVAGNYIFGISKSVAGNVSDVIDTAKNSSINKM
ncbi:class III signal peptide-containing protein [Methanobacterium sp. ACI-7]|uniref:class III signal peptide-containing protein n=1 Tax=unclassified Methanobacterium TaxID=2627676 RepID=UPI0039C3253D